MHQGHLQGKGGEGWGQGQIDNIGISWPTPKTKTLKLNKHFIKYNEDE